MDNSIWVIVLAMVTLAIVLVLGFVQIGKVRHSQAKRGERPGGIAGPSSD